MSSTMLYRFFITLQLCGAIGMAVILLSAIFSPIIKRCSTWYTFCASWIISCISYSLLFFAGGRDQLYHPNKSLCITQASLIYSVPILTSLTTLALLVHSWYNVHFGISRPPLETNRKIMIVFLLAPFVVWFLVFVSFLGFGFANSSLVAYLGNTPYCIINSNMPPIITSLFVIIICCSMLPIQASLGLSLYKNMYTNDCNNRISVPTLKVVIRVMIFSLLTLVAFGEGCAHIFSVAPGEVVDIIMAWLPVSGVLIFGIQRDILKTWARLPKSHISRDRKDSTLPALIPDSSP